MLLNLISFLEDPEQVTDLKSELKASCIAYTQPGASVTAFELGYDLHIFGALQSLKLTSANTKMTSHFFGQAATHAWSMMLNPEATNADMWLRKCARASFLSIKYLPNDRENIYYRLDRTIELVQSIILGAAAGFDPLCVDYIKSLTMIDLLIQEIGYIKGVTGNRYFETIEKLQVLIQQVSKLLKIINQNELQMVDAARLQTLYGVLDYVVSISAKQVKGKPGARLERGVVQIVENFQYAGVEEEIEIARFLLSLYTFTKRLFSGHELQEFLSNAIQGHNYSEGVDLIQRIIETPVEW